ncbi:MAG: glycosyltransferase family 4 protein [Thaumarchaeota archaeon]|jgi:glycosyltransferase involved in cell wall biosynthesis|nr:glycosyltransferase family 4 protein [Candidatus Geocrenenecus arthurdayi]
MIRVMTFVRRIAGLLEPSLESEFYEEFTELSKYLELIVVSDIVDSLNHRFKVYRAWTIRIPKLYGLSKILSYCYAVFKFRKSVDVIYVRTFSPPETTALWLGKKVFGKKTILLLPSTWFFEPPSLKNRIYKWILAKAVYAADLIILYTPLMLPEIEKNFPKIMKEKIKYLHNGVNTERFTPGEPDIDIVKRYISSEKLEKLLLYVGRISRKKGVIDLVKSFSKIVEKEPDTILALAGREEKWYADEVRRVIKELRIEDNIVFLGPVPNKDVIHLMRACSLFVYSSIGGEGIPRAILEAMACGKPVVATRVSGIPEAVRDGETGYIVEVGDYEVFSDRVLRILRDKGLRERMSMNARALIEREFNYEKIIPQLVQLIEGLCGKTRVVNK